jgi:hypothetical protein
MKKQGQNSIVVSNGARLRYRYLAKHSFTSLMYLKRKTASEKKKFKISSGLQFLVLFSDSTVQVYCVCDEKAKRNDKMYILLNINHNVK